MARGGPACASTALAASFLCVMDFVGLVVVEDDPGAFAAGRPGGICALEHVANRPIAHHVLDALRSAGVRDVVVASSKDQAGVVHECLDASVHSKGVRLKFVECPGPLDLAGAVGLAAPVVGRAPCIVHLANGLLGEPLNPLIGLVRRDRPDVVLFAHERASPDSSLSAGTREMLRLGELQPHHASFGIAGVWLFGRDALQHAAVADWWDGDEVDLTTLAAPISSAEGNVQVRLVDAWSRYAGDPGDLLQLNTITLDRLPANGCRADNSGNTIEGRVHIDSCARVSTSTIIGPVVVGPDARISDAYIGPYTSIGAGAKIVGAEIERSVVCAGASVTYVGARLIMSVIGPDARVFKDFSLPRALRLQIGRGAGVALW